MEILWIFCGYFVAVDDDLAEAVLRMRAGLGTKADLPSMLSKTTGEGTSVYRQLHVSLVSSENIVPSSTTKEAEKQKERDLARKADDLGEFYIPMGKAPHFVTDSQLNDYGGKPEVIEEMFKVRLTDLHQRSHNDDDPSRLQVSVLDEYSLDPFEHASCLSVVRLFDESQTSIDYHTPKKV